jgi:hypothetical protein
LAKWKLFDRKKEPQQPKIKEIEVEPRDELVTKPDNEIIEENNEEQEELPILDYKETLYSKDVRRKFPEKKEEIVSKQWKRTSWESVETIEENIDSLNQRKFSKMVKGGAVEKKLDKILEKKHRKPSNVIYVVSRPQPGQLRGDWAVRSHGKIYSHHRKKIVAIKAARQIAKEKEATVMIQKTNGTFSRGFKPRTD